MKAVTCTNAKLEVVDRPSPRRPRVNCCSMCCGAVSADRTCMPACTVMNWPT